MTLKRWGRAGDILKKVAGAMLAVGIVAIGTSAPAQALFRFPHQLSVPTGEDAYVAWSKWLPATVVVGAHEVVRVRDMSQLDIHTGKVGHYVLHFRLFGWLPWRGLPVDATKPIYVVPGGESVGILVRTRGLVVSGLHGVHIGNRVVDPAFEAGIERGDVITRVDNKVATSGQVLDRQVSYDGEHQRPVTITVVGSRRQRQREIQPVWSSQAHHWLIGVEIQDRASGVGTLSFYNPSSLQYTALGHSMTDGLTRRPVGVQIGRALGADIVGIVRASDSAPGQKVGMLAGSHNISGSVLSNSEFGVVGHLDHVPVWGPTRAMVLALPDQVKPGAAEIITVLRGQKPQAYHIDILKTADQTTPAIKGLLFKVTDPQLLRITGGIVQGMSGSPIIQDGRLVGAVTHVLISRPTIGFGCYAYWMEDQDSYRQGSTA